MSQRNAKLIRRVATKCHLEARSLRRQLKGMAHRRRGRVRLVMERINLAETTSWVLLRARIVGAIAKGERVWRRT